MNTLVRPILLVEDNPMDVDLTLQAFTEHGVANTIVVCRDGEEAVRYMEAHAEGTDPQLPIVVLLDSGRGSAQCRCGYCASRCGESGSAIFRARG